MIEEFLVPELESDEGMWFQQDGAPSHTARETLDLLNRLFENRVISKKANINSPARSPNLNPLDFFLWGYLKDRVYSNSPKTLDELKENIERDIDNISEDMFQNVMRSFRSRL
uniref:Transposable element Tc3 transposase n=1 Tax=Strongyloides stercoralis TaxID=6248 RepID=A0A0K0EGT5_STRER